MPGMEYEAAAIFTGPASDLAGLLVLAALSPAAIIAVNFL
jgi:hypothetical protein